MKRILVFDSECSLCTGVARKVCNETGELIQDVWSLKDVRTQEILSAAGFAGLARPALIEITSEKTTVFAGPRFGWRMFRILGPQRALRLAKVIAGDLAAAALPAEVDANRQAGGAPVVGRRGFLVLMTGLAAGFVVVTGLGFSKFARKATMMRMRSSADSVEPFWYGWTKNLDLQTAQTVIVTGAERELRWRKFLSSVNLKQLVSSRGFEAHPAAPDVREALSSAAIPHSFENYEIGDPARSLFITRQYLLKNGKKVNLDVLTTSNVMVHTLELVHGERVVRRGLKLFEVDVSTKGLEVIASLANGTFQFRSAKFIGQVAKSAPDGGRGGVPNDGSNGRTV
jgi:hypothetical protein